MKYNRLELLFEDDFEKLSNTKILLCGVGGVGSFALDALYRSSITNITIIDFDIYEESNLNRQLGSDGAIGRVKVDRLKELYPNVNAINMRLTPEIINEFDFSEFDIVIDAIDDIPSKVALAKKTHKKLVSSCGGAKRLDPTKIEFANIWDVIIDPFGKKFKYELKQAGFKEDFDVVFSTENPKKIEGLGSFVGVTGSFGLAVASLVVKKILKT
ncbi:MAG: tRNA cyclic N6-threonylcarbamoyladenosine(37) synthase TcdA [uncultured Campylobacterales bacterium]|uniref:tRNA cyclic N6-threonylcarbamoyladenosine(37) synthase TcdA n=1 Tax=uncultured Campylobacterales bacterium TaxID=352960 RepID=A0A6S6SV97_9BACT|nr:MAG: tRNA cyclic N6-threonylcarbamoyladenosine(37) synthase TcdA [uncultured Campylobacterales bacterium]